MKKLTCAEVDELLAGYALNALKPDEAAAMEAHVGSCNKHAELVELEQTVSVLALAGPEAIPAPDLRARILAATATSEPSRPGATRGAEQPVVVPIRRTPRKRGWAPPRALVAVAAAALLTLGGGIGYLVGLANSGQQVFVFHGNQLAPDATAQLVYFKDHHRAVVAVSGLPALQPGQVYEMWLIKGTTPTPAGIAQATNGRFASQLDADVTQYEQFAITVEPREMPAPTSTPLLAGQL